MTKYANLFLVIALTCSFSSEIDARLNEPDLVVKGMNEVLKADPLFTDAYKVRARAYVYLNKFAASLPDFNKAINLEQHGQRFVLSASIGSNIHGLILERAKVYDVLGQHAAAAPDRETARQYARDEIQDVPFRTRATDLR